LDYTLGYLHTNHTILEGESVEKVQNNLLIIQKVP